MAERNFVIVRKYRDQVPSMASCAKCQYKFFTPSDFRRDRISAELYLLDKFDLHECRDGIKSQSNGRHSARLVILPDAAALVGNRLKG